MKSSLFQSGLRLAFRCDVDVEEEEEEAVCREEVMVECWMLNASPVLGVERRAVAPAME